MKSRPEIKRHILKKLKPLAISEGYSKNSGQFIKDFGHAYILCSTSFHWQPSGYGQLSIVVELFFPPATRLLELDFAGSKPCLGSGLEGWGYTGKNQDDSWCFLTEQEVDAIWPDIESQFIANLRKAELLTEAENFFDLLFDLEKGRLIYGTPDSRVCAIFRRAEIYGLGDLKVKAAVKLLYGEREKVRLAIEESIRNPKPLPLGLRPIGKSPYKGPFDFYNIKLEQLNSKIRLICDHFDVDFDGYKSAVMEVQLP